LASGSDDKTVRLWAPETGRLLRTLEGHQNWVRAVAWHPEGRQLASGSADQTVRLWEPETGRLLRTLEGHLGPVLGVVWLGEGRTLASCSADGTIRIWDAGSARCLAVLHQFRDGGWLTLTPEGRYIGNASGKRRLTFLDNWALYPASVFPEFEDPEAVRAALTA